MEPTKPFEKKYCACPEVDLMRFAIRLPGYICIQCNHEARMDYEDIVAEELPMILRWVWPCF